MIIHYIKIIYTARVSIDVIVLHLFLYAQITTICLNSFSFTFYIGTQYIIVKAINFYRLLFVPQTTGFT